MPAEALREPLVRRRSAAGGETGGRARLAAAGLDAVRTDFNAYVLRHADGSVDLVDTGCGTQFGDQGGALTGALAEMGIAPETVDRILFTHLHGDHAGGALNGQGAAFPNAEIVLHSAEAAHWRGQDKPGGQVLAVYDRVRLVEDGADLGHGIRLWHLPGHTPGHCGLRIGSNLVLVGDIVHSEALQLPQPALRPMFDVDPAQAAASCTAALTEIADGGLVWSGSHMLGPDKFARLVRDGAGFRRQPV